MRIALLLTLAAACSLLGCQSKEKKAHAEISRLEQSMEKQAELGLAQTLLERYEAFAGQFPEEDDWNSKYLYRAAALAYRMNRYSRAIELLERALREDYPGSNTLNNALLLAAIYEEKLRNEELTRTIYQATALAFPENEEVKKQLDSSWPPLDQRLEKLKNQVIDTVSGRTDYRMANDFISSTTIHALLLPQNEQSAEWLFEGARIAREIRAYSKALELYAWIGDHFPDHPKAPETLFLQAFTLDNDLSRFEEAGEMYRLFLEKYPDNELADDAQLLLDILGKDEEEIIRSFEEKNQ